MKRPPRIAKDTLAVPVSQRGGLKGTFKDDVHYRWIKRQPCVLTGFCGRQACDRTDAHHVLHQGQDERQGRRDDRMLVPLCHKVHMERHDKLGREGAFWAAKTGDPNFGINAARRLWAQHEKDRT